IDRVLDVVIDTDPMNEIDDQFAIAWALLRPDRLRVRALHAAPWISDERVYAETDPEVDRPRHEQRTRPSVGPAEGQRQALQELRHLVDLLGTETPVVAGADRFLPDATTPVPSDAVDNLLCLAHEEREGPLYVLGIACATNLASALLTDPSIAPKVCVVWTSAHPSFWPRAVASYNLMLDLHASRVLLDSGVPLVYLPGYYVWEELRTTRAELEQHVRGQGPVGDYLWQTWEDHWMTRTREPGFSKVIWDLINVAYLLEPSWLATDLVPSPVLGEDLRWHHPPGRHLIREAHDIDRDAVFGDLFNALRARRQL
ncbi:MAG: nucleoside hydrolase, partial [Mycobacteriales bacterium]